MITFVVTKRSTQEELSRKRVTDNWWNVYQDRARFEGRRLHWLSDKAYEVIFTEKDKTVTLIKD